MSVRIIQGDVREELPKLPAEAVKEEATGATNTATFRSGGAYTGGRSFDNSARVPVDSTGRKVNESGMRSLRNVWHMSSPPFRGAHFATFPPKLVERCIKAGSSERGCCPACGKPWVRVIGKGWQPSCKCYYGHAAPDEWISRARILDPFAGAGTTGLVADRLGRDCTLIDLNTSYIEMAVNRIREDSPLFAEIAAE